MKLTVGSSSWTTKKMTFWVKTKYPPYLTSARMNSMSNSWNKKQKKTWIITYNLINRGKNKTSFQNTKVWINIILHTIVVVRMWSITWRKKKMSKTWKKTWTCNMKTKRLRISSSNCQIFRISLIPKTNKWYRKKWKKRKLSAKSPRSRLRFYKLVRMGIKLIRWRKMMQLSN